MGRDEITWAAFLRQVGHLLERADASYCAHRFGGDLRDEDEQLVEAVVDLRPYLAAVRDWPAGVSRQVSAPPAGSHRDRPADRKRRRATRD